MSKVNVHEAKTQLSRLLERAHAGEEIIIAKNRHGPTDTVEMQFDAARTKFSDLAPDDQLPARYGEAA